MKKEKKKLGQKYSRDGQGVRLRVIRVRAGNRDRETNYCYHRFDKTVEKINGKRHLR